MADSAASEHHPGGGAGETDGETVAGMMGAELEPVLRGACGGALSRVRWFRTDWQRGGALTGYATFDTGTGPPREVVVKMPVRPRERRWLQRLQPADGDDAPPCVPALLAHGESLHGYDLVWVVMERLAHGPLGEAWAGREFDLTVTAAGRFYQRASPHPPDAPPAEIDWPAALDRARQKVRQRAVPHEQRWKEALKHAHKKLPGWLDDWHARPRDHWCHGDLHLGNAMSTHAPDHHAGDAHAVLLDLAEVHAGHWVEDAVYFEHLFWAQRPRLEGRKLCSMLAKERKHRGLPVGDDWSRLAAVKRALTAIGVAATLPSDITLPHLEAALDVLERA